MSISTRIAYSDLASAFTVQSGAPIRVSCIMITNTTAAAIEYTIQNGAGTATLALVQVGVDSTEVIAGSEPFLFDAGLRFAAAASTSHVTVFYQPGA